MHYIFIYYYVLYILYAKLLQKLHKHLQSINHVTKTHVNDAVL